MERRFRIQNPDQNRYKSIQLGLRSTSTLEHRNREFDRSVETLRPPQQKSNRSNSSLLHRSSAQSILKEARKVQN